MKLPHYENAVIAEAKITKYLLDESHEDGKTKAAFFIRFGFSLSQWKVLAEALKQHALLN